MSVAQYGLTWDSHKNHVCGGFVNLQQNEEFVDMTLAADGHLVNVHKSVLALASPYIKAMIQATTTPHPVIFLSNVSHEVLSYILTYVYTGEVFVDTDKIKLFMKAAEELRITGLRDLEAPKVGWKEPGKQSDLKLKNPIKTTNNDRSSIRNKHVNTCFTAHKAENSDSINTVQEPAFNEENFLELTNNQEMTNPEESNVPGDTNINDIEQQPVLDETKFSEPVIYQTMPNHGTTDNLSVHVIDMNKPALYEEINIKSSTNQSLANQDKMLSNITHLNNVNTEKQIEVLDEISLFKPENATLPNNGIQNNSNNSDCGFHTTADGYQFRIDLFDGKNESKIEPVHMDVDKFHHIQEQKDKKSNPIIASLPTIEIDSTRTSFYGTKESLDPKAVVPLYTKSNRGCLQLILNRYMYYCHHQSHGGRKRRWRCIEYRRRHCPAFIDTDCDVMSVRKNAHVHSYHDDKIMKKINRNLVFTNLNTGIQRLNASKSESDQ